MTLREAAESALRDLRNHYMKVILIDAPHQNFSGHKIRYVENRPPLWYMRLVYGRYTNVKRGRFMACLKKIAKGEKCTDRYYEIALEFLRERAKEVNAEYWENPRRRRFRSGRR